MVNRLLSTFSLVGINIFLASSSKHDGQSKTAFEECRPDNLTISINAALVIDCINAFKDDYTIVNLGLPWDEAVTIYPDVENDRLPICNQEDQCFNVLPNITQGHHDPPSSGDELELTLVQTLGFAQRYSTAFDTLFLDEILYDNNFEEEMKDAKGFVDVLSIELEDAVLSCGLRPSENLIQDLITKSYLGVASPDMRGLRGFGSLRQCLIGMNYIIEMFPVNEL
ncbi:uncharacterized protein [Palaemon carinicauda]|uniref:uncharacterized protein n=1 Tax=Palaemon carinicauda TaxID=392227 RepID=UPI0035B6971E